jgi:large subunit ribosomal protein L18
MDSAKQRKLERSRRAARIRKTVFGTQKRPRLCVTRTLNHISAQIIDDLSGKSLVQVTSAAKDIKAKIPTDKKARKLDVSKTVGEVLAEKAKAQGITTVVLDRKGFLYHGRVKALADAARSKGLVF